jgi:Tol biopolymer transport system component
MSLGSAAAAWARGYSCSNLECDWDVVGISAGARRPWTVDSPAPACDPECGGGYAPRPVFGGGGGLLVYAGGGVDGSTDNDQVKQIVGRRAFPLFKTGGDIERLAVSGGGVVEAVSRVLVGDGCGCLDSPAWSPDGSKLAYLHGVFSVEGTSARVAVMNSDGSDRHDLEGTPPKAEYNSVTWSPDGTRIAYTAGYGPTGQGKIAIASVDGSGSRLLAPGYNPTWSPDGSKIAFATLDSSTPAIFVMSPDGSDIQKLASLAGRIDLSYGDTFGMAWSPDGTRIAFTSLDNKALEVMNADGSDPHALTNTHAYDTPTWSPDSSQIIFGSLKGLDVIGAGGSGLQQLTQGPDLQPSWSPNGKTIVFASLRDDPYFKTNRYNDQRYLELYLVDTDGTDLRPLSFTHPSAWKNEATFRSASGHPLPPLPGLPALAGDTAATASIYDGADQITLSDAHTGMKHATVTLGHKQPHFSLAGADKHWIVFHRGTTIAALNVSSHRVVALTREVVKPLDLSVSGHCVAWAENSGGRGSIRTLELPS